VQQTFRWQLEISEEDNALALDKKPIGTRFKVARSDASVKTIQTTIEKVFGLPHGSVCLLTPDGQNANLHLHKKPEEQMETELTLTCRRPCRGLA
jgi:uncharacterized protein YigA (DUF484 family)